jgi:hypothetical protein
MTTASAYQRNLPNCEAHDPPPVKPGMQASGLFAGHILRILAAAKGEGLVAQKRPPRLSRSPACVGHIARHRCLGDAETEHAKLAMDPWRTPEKVLTGHPCDQLADLAFDPGPSSAPTTTRAIAPQP